MTRNERLQRRFERQLLKREFKSMEHKDMSKEWHKYMQGKPMLAREFRTVAGGRLFGEIVWEDHRRDDVTAQISLPGFEFLGFDTVWQKVHPIEIKNAEQDHLKEVRELKNGVSQTIVCGFDNAFEGMRINDIRQELEALSGNGTI